MPSHCIERPMKRDYLEARYLIVGADLPYPRLMSRRLSVRFAGLERRLLLDTDDG